MEKKFQIHKKFDIQKEESTKKKFIIHERQRSETRKWFRQENTNDCGPCMILNSIALLNIPTEDTSISQVREKINQVRAQDRTRQEIPPDGWFTSRDVQEYFTRAGLSVREEACVPDEKSRIEEKLRGIFENRNFDLIYITSGRHFRAILDKDGQLYLLDSFLAGPISISTEEAWELIANTISISTQTRIERVGVITR